MVHESSNHQPEQQNQTNISALQKSTSSPQSLFHVCYLPRIVDKKKKETRDQGFVLSRQEFETLCREIGCKQSGTKSKDGGI